MDEEPNKDPAPHLEPHRWKKGQSGNPSGKPKGAVSMVTALKRYLREHPEKADELAEEMVSCALDSLRHRDPVTGAAATGSTANSIIKTILERLDGAVPKETILSGDVHVKRLVLGNEDVTHDEEAPETDG